MLKELFSSFGIQTDSLKSLDCNSDKITIVYNRDEQINLIVYNCFGCKVYNNNGLKFVIKMADNDSTFDISELEYTHGLEIYKHLDPILYLPLHIITNHSKSVFDYLWAIDQKTQTIYCVINENKVLSFYEQNNLIFKYNISDGQDLHQIISNINIDTIFPSYAH